MPETFEILSNSAMYKNSTAPDQYKELFKVINFTKIADMLYLITHHGVVSDSEIVEASEKNDDKELAYLMSRRKYTDIYMRQYDLKEIDCSLDKMYPEPIGLGRNSQWYTIASKMLSDAFRGVQMKINSLTSFIIQMLMESDSISTSSRSVHFQYF